MTGQKPTVVRLQSDSGKVELRVLPYRQGERFSRWEDCHIEMRSGEQSFSCSLRLEYSDLEGLRDLLRATGDATWTTFEEKIGAKLESRSTGGVELRFTLRKTHPFFSFICADLDMDRAALDRSAAQLDGVLSSSA